MGDTEPQNNLIHYLLHHLVFREDKSTTKFKIVYNASARDCGSSHNDCLYIVPKFSQNIIERHELRFRTHTTALVADT